MTKRILALFAVLFSIACFAPATAFAAPEVSLYFEPSEDNPLWDIEALDSFLQEDPELISLSGKVELSSGVQADSLRLSIEVLSFEDGGSSAPDAEYAATLIRDKTGLDPGDIFVLPYYFNLEFYALGEDGASFFIRDISGSAKTLNCALLDLPLLPSYLEQSPAPKHFFLVRLPLDADDCLVPDVFCTNFESDNPWIYFEANCSAVYVLAYTDKSYTASLSYAVKPVFDSSGQSFGGADHTGAESGGSDPTDGGSGSGDDGAPEDGSGSNDAESPEGGNSQEDDPTQNLGGDDGSEDGGDETSGGDPIDDGSSSSGSSSNPSGGSSSDSSSDPSSRASDGGTGEIVGSLAGIFSLAFLLLAALTKLVV